jgi:hypothetical protein
MVGATQAPTPPIERCQQVVFTGEIKAGEKFTREIGNGLSFRMDPWGKDGGWEFEIGPTTPEVSEWNQYVYTVTPPYRSSGARDINTGWGTLAQDAVGTHPRVFWFLVRRSDNAAATDALNKILWPKSDVDQKAGLDFLRSLPKGSGEFTIIDSRITRGTAVAYSGDPNPEHYGAIHWLKFQVKLVVPEDFRVASDLQPRPAQCPAKTWW